MKHVTSLLSLLFLTATAAFAGENFVIDRSHSSTAFKVRHLIARTSGRFTDFSGTVNLDKAKMVNSTVEFTINAASIDTDNESRDKHLRSADFFDVEKFPTITFKSKSIRQVSKDKFQVTGDFTMKGVTKTIVLPVDFTGIVRDPGGNERAGFSTSFTLNRKDYGIVWNRSLDEGGVLLGDDVDVTIDLETVKKKEPAPATAK